VAALVAVFASARAGAFPWSTDMFRGPSVQPLAVPPRVVPKGVLPVHGGEPPMDRDTADRVLREPLGPTPAHLRRGELLFGINCAPCHGAAGRGDGPVATHTVVPATDLTAGEPTRRSDGYLYATIRNGGAVMPAYGDATSVTERWELVLWVRRLQGEGHP
jgi:mono/diheme cytochrome c family protein